MSEEFEGSMTIRNTIVVGEKTRAQERQSLLSHFTGDEEVAVKKMMCHYVRQGRSS